MSAMVAILTVLLSVTVFSVPMLAQTSIDLAPTETGYGSDYKDYRWLVTIKDTSTYDGLDQPIQQSSRYVIQKFRNSRAVGKPTEISVPNIPNENGVVAFHLETLSHPLFIVFGARGELADSQNMLSLISPGCMRPLGQEIANIEDTSQLKTKVNPKDFAVTFSRGDHEVTKKWTVPTDLSKVCQQKWQ